jgi:predicted extracellular nuclease
MKRISWVSFVLLAAMVPTLAYGNGAPVRIHDIQGAAHTSPLAGQSVSGVVGIVTAKLSNGFYMQDPSPDGDDATSEGIFVFTSTLPTVNVGDAVQVSGTVSEFRPGGPSSANLTTTEIGNPGRTIVVLSSGNPLPAPVIVGIGGRIPPSTVIEDDATGNVETSGVFDPSSDGIDFYESLEGMRIQIDDAVVVGPINAFGEVPVVGDKGVVAGVRTARGGLVVGATDFNPERIILDSLITPLPAVNVGDSFPGPIVGVLDYNFGNYMLHVTALPAAVSGELKAETTSAPVDGEVAIATFDLDNLDPTDVSGRVDALASQIVNNLRSPDIVAVQGIEDSNGQMNDGVVDASTTYSTLITAIQNAGGPTYDYRQIDPVNNQDGGQPGTNIRVAFLFRADRGLDFVDRPGGDSTTATTVVSGATGPELSFSPGRVDPTNIAFTNSRKPLAGEFTFNGLKLFVVVTHLVSKGGDSPLFGRFQPLILASEPQRILQAQVVHDFVQSILSVDSKANVVVLGDFNDYEFTTALTTLKDSALQNLTESLPQPERYSFVFEGNSEALDHILVSDGLFSGRPLTYDIVHVNSEFVDQTSGHDPAVVRIQTAAEQLTALSPAKLWIGLRNSDSVGLRVDLLAEVFLKIGTSATKIGEGELDNQSTGGSGFNNALLATISSLALDNAPVTVPSGARLQFTLSVRRTCSGGGHNSGVVRLWYNGKPIDAGSSRDAGSRFDATLGGQTDNYFPRTSFALGTSAGSSRTFIDQTVDSKVPCGATPPFTRPFSPFGTWTLTVP